MFNKVVPMQYSRTKNICVMKQTFLLYLSFIENYPRIEELATNLYKGILASENEGYATIIQNIIAYNNNLTW